jgi:hypothetical protein
MGKPFVFVSCGLFTEAERRLGEQVADIVRYATGHDVFFAPQVQDLNGLRENVLEALHTCSGFIAILHPRGEIKPSDKLPFSRASVWVEQEIAIATYSQYVQKRPLPVIAFIHKSVGLEGIRTLLQLNPIPFGHDIEVIAELPKRLESWKTLTPKQTIHLELSSRNATRRDNHQQHELEVHLVNETGRRLPEFDLLLQVPELILKHSSPVFLTEERQCPKSYRCFRYNQGNIGTAIMPVSRSRLVSLEYCSECAFALSLADTGSGEAVFEKEVHATVWIDGEEYSATKTLNELHRELSRGASPPLF